MTDAELDKIEAEAREEAEYSDDYWPNHCLSLIAALRAARKALTEAEAERDRIVNESVPVPVDTEHAASDCRAAGWTTEGAILEVLEFIDNKTAAHERRRARMTTASTCTTVPSASD